MLATLDNNHLLCIEDTTLDTGKIYQQQFQGYHISEKNKLLFVLHKKEIKLMELKNIGSTMGVFYIGGRQPFQLLRLVPEFVQLAGEHFGGFDEETGERYYFFPFFPPQRMEAMNAICSKLNIPLQLQQSAKGVISAWRETNNSPTAANGGMEQLLGHLFGLVLLYGKFEHKA